MTTKKPHPIRNFILVWLASSLLCLSYAFLISTLHGTPSWLDVLILYGWTIWGSRWLVPLAERLDRWPPIRWAAIGLLLITCLGVALPWIQRLPIEDSLWQPNDAGYLSLTFDRLTFTRILYTIPGVPYAIGHYGNSLWLNYTSGIATPSTHLRMIGLLLTTGLGLAVLSLSWCIVWRALLNIQAFANLWTRFSRSHTAKRIKRWLRAYLLVLLLLTGYIVLHIPASYLYDNPLGAATRIPHRMDISVAWLIAILAALAIGRIQLPRWPRILLLAASLICVLIFIISSAELNARGTFISQDLIDWVNENAWINPYHAIHGELGAVFVPENFTLTGVILSLISIASTFRELIWYLAIVPVIDPRWNFVGGYVLVPLTVIFSAALTLLGAAIAVIVTVVQDFLVPAVTLKRVTVTAPQWIKGDKWRSVRPLFLTWIVSTLLCATYAFLIAARPGIPNWLDAAIFFVWIILASRWLDSLAAPLYRRRWTRWTLALLLGLTGLLLLPWALLSPAQGGLWRTDETGRWLLDFSAPTLSGLLLTAAETLFVAGRYLLDLANAYRQGQTTWTTHAQTIRWALALGFVPSAAALAYRVTWRALLDFSPVATLWRWLCNAWAALRRTRLWYWAQRGLAWTLIGLLILNILGILLTAFPTAVAWDSTPTTDFPSGPPLSVSSLAVGPDGKTLFAGTPNGLYRQTDHDATWEIVRGLNAPTVQTLIVGPDQSLYAGTDGGGVFRSDDNGASWLPVNQGLTSLDVRALTVGPDGQGGTSLFAGTQSYQTDGEGNTQLVDNVYHSDDGGRSWHSIPELSTSDLEQNGVFQDVRITAIDGRISLTRPGMGWLPWATHQYQAPQALAIRGDRVTLYASAGAAMMLHAEIPLPLIWNLPTSYLALVAATWSAIYWAIANAVPLSVGLGLLLAVVSLYVYAGVARPNRLRPATVLWLLPRPRHLVAAAAYRTYAGRWAAGNPLERLILLQVPTEKSFTPAELEAKLGQLGAAFDVSSLHTALATLHQRVLLAREPGPENGDSNWRLTDPLLAQVQRRELGGDEPARLVEQIRQTHPLHAETRRFFAQAGFTVQPAGPFGLLCTSSMSLWADLCPLYVRLILDRPLDLDEFRDLCAAAEAAFDVPMGGSLRGCTAAIAIDRPPRASDLHQIFALRADQAFTIIPFSETYTNLGKARLLFGSCFTEVCPHKAGLTSSPQASLPAKLAVEFVAN